MNEPLTLNFDNVWWFCGTKWAGNASHVGTDETDYHWRWLIKFAKTKTRIPACLLQKVSSRLSSINHTESNRNIWMLSNDLVYIEPYSFILDLKTTIWWLWRVKQYCTNYIFLKTCFKTFSFFATLIFNLASNWWKVIQCTCLFVNADKQPIFIWYMTYID